MKKGADNVPQSWCFSCRKNKIGKESKRITKPLSKKLVIATSTHSKAGRSALRTSYVKAFPNDKAGGSRSVAFMKAKLDRKAAKKTSTDILAGL